MQTWIAPDDAAWEHFHNLDDVQGLRHQLAMELIHPLEYAAKIEELALRGGFVKESPSAGQLGA